MPEPPDAAFSAPKNYALPQPAADIPASYSSLLWDEAYDEVKQDYPDMVTWYEKTLSTELERVGEEGTTPPDSSLSSPFTNPISQIIARQTRRAQMNNLLQGWLSEVDSKEQSEDIDSNDDGMEEFSIIKYKQILRKAVEATSPNALLAWVGVCFASRIFLNPNHLWKDDRLELIHVISRMDWYGRLPGLLSQGVGVDNTESQLRRCIVHLYKAILSYEMNTLGYHSGSPKYSSCPEFSFQPYGRDEISLERIMRAEVALPIFNEKLVRLPLMKYMSLSEKKAHAEGRVFVSPYESKHVDEMPQDLHVDDPWQTTLGAVDDPSMQDVYGQLCGTDEYRNIRNWEQKDNALLWIRGAAGQGKTMLMKSIIHAISKQSDSPRKCLSFFFFDSCSPGANNAATALSNLMDAVYWHVVARGSRSSLSAITNSKCFTIGRATFDDPNDFFALSGMLYDMTQSEEFPETYFVLNALDDCSSEVGRPGLADLLKFIQESIHSSARVRWIVSSGFSDTIELALGKNKQCVTVDLSAFDYRNAINHYIKSKIGVLAETEGYDKDLKSVIVATLCDGLPRNYVQVDVICEALKSEEKWYVESILDEVKALNDLDRLYEYLKAKLERYPRYDGSFCLQILSTLAVLNRTSSLSELERLVCLGPRVDLRSIVKKCSCFLHLSNNDIVSFHHQSAINYMRKHGRPASQVYPDIVRNCINALVKVLAIATRDGCWIPLSIESWFFLDWLNYVSDMIKEVVTSNESGEVSEIDPKVANKVSSFLREHFMIWLEVLSSRNLLPIATILLRRVDLLLQAKLDEPNELSATIRDAHLITNLHMSTKTPAHISAANTALFRPTESILQMKSSQDESYQVEVLHLGNKEWRRDFGLLKGHTDCVCSVAFSLDGRLIASGSDDGSVRIWDTDMWTTQHTLEIGVEVDCVAFSSKGHIAAASLDGDIIIWDSSLGRELYRLQAKPLVYLYAPAFSPDARYLIAATSSHSLRIWDFNSRPEKCRDIRHDDTALNSVSFSCDGRLIASGGENGKIYIWDSWYDENCDKPRFVFGDHSEEVTSVVFSPATRPGYLASCSNDGTAKIWTFDEEEPRCSLTLSFSGFVSSVSFSPNGLQLAAIVESGTIEIWDIVVGDRLETMRASNQSNIMSMAFSPTGDYIITSSSRDYQVHLWHTANKNTTKKTYTQPPVTNKCVSELAVAPHGQTIAARHDDGKVTLWNMNDEDGTPIYIACWPQLKVYCLAFSPDGLSLAFGFSDGSVQIYDVAKHEKLERFTGHTKFVRSVAWSPTGKYLASGSGGQTIAIYQKDDQTKGWKEIHGDIHSEDSVMTVAFSPNEAKLYLAAGGRDGKVAVWRQEGDSWVSHFKINAHSESIRSIVFTPDGARIVSAANDLTLRIWDFKTQDLLAEIPNTQVAHTHMRFENDWEKLGYVMTGMGPQSIPPSITSPPDWCPYRYEVDEKERGEGWITRYGKKIIFIPEIFKPTATYFMSDRFIIGMESGFLMVFRFSEKESGA